MRKLLRAALILLPLQCVVFGQHWEVGVAGGYGFLRDVPVTAGTVSGTAGMAPGMAAGALLGNQISRFVGGEVRYTYQADDLRVTAGSVTAKATAQTHAIHYDVLIHATNKDARVRPFLAAGAGVKLYRGTGTEPAYQPLSNLVLLTHTNEAKPLVSFGGGIKVSVSPRVLFRIDVRDYATPVPSNLLATPPGSKMSGWMHDFVFLVGISSVF